jgi:NADH-quinone oxidoreductase subunit L
MGGLRKYIPYTFMTMLAAALAISGFPFTSGFFSKDAILMAAYHHAPWMYWVGVVTAGMTAFYVFRSIFLAFFGKYRGQHHPHESPFVMTGPLIILAILSLAGGFIPVPQFLEPIFPKSEEPHDPMLAYIATGAGLLGIALAYLFYVVKPALADSMARTFSGPYRLLYNKYFVDEMYDASVVEPTVQGSRSILWKGFDAGLIDGAVNGLGGVARNIGWLLKRAQSGNIRSYAAWVVLGSVVVIIAMGIRGGVR